MSYVLHIWEAPKASNIEEAVAVVYHGNKEVGISPKFLAFAKALTTTYPDLTLSDQKKSV